VEGVLLSIREERLWRSGSHPNVFPISEATLKVGALSVKMSHAFVAFGSDTPSPTAEWSTYICWMVGGSARYLDISA
jgi:hypothetical protein